MKTLFKPLSVAVLTVCAILAILAIAPNAGAQVAGNYSTTFVGGTSSLGAATTNTYVMGYVNGTNANAPTLNCSEHPDVGLIVYYAGTTAFTNGNFKLSVFRSYDNGNTYETTAFTNISIALPTVGGAGTTNETVFDLRVPNANQLAIGSIGNTCAAGYATNVYVNWNINTPRHLKQDASSSAPYGTPTPSINSTNWVP